jgi:sugar lactone lactonase YvrE
MRNSKRVVSAGLVLAVVATAGCSSSTSPKSAPIGGLWVANWDTDTTPEFSTNQLVSGTQTPAVHLITSGSCTTGLALDASGNMWQSDCGTDVINMYSAKARNAGGAVTPTAILTSPILQNEGPGQLAFDSNGNLWLAACGNGSGGAIVEYTAAQLTAAGTQAPTSIEYTSALGNNFCPWSIAFDANGNAWVGDDGIQEVIEYSAAQLTPGSNDVTPATTITGADQKWAGGVAFDKNGNLWVANDDSPTGSVVGYTPAQLAAGGSITPNVIITMPSPSDPFGLAFDSHGSLWVSDLDFEGVYSLTSAQLVTGTPTPNVALISNLHDLGPVQPMFDPYATTKGAVSAAYVRHTVVAAAVAGRANRPIQRNKSAAGSHPSPW